MFGVLLENDHVVGHIHCSVLFHHRQVTNNTEKKGKRKLKRKRRGSLRRNHDKARHYMQLKNKYLTLKNSWIPDPENHIHPTLRIREKFLQIYCKVMNHLLCKNQCLFAVQKPMAAQAIPAESLLPPTVHYNEKKKNPPIRFKN